MTAMSSEVPVKNYGIVIEDRLTEIRIGVFAFQNYDWEY